MYGDGKIAVSDNPVGISEFSGANFNGRAVYGTIMTVMGVCANVETMQNESSRLGFAVGICIGG